jgi:hypothetical protein
MQFPTCSKRSNTVWNFGIMNIWGIVLKCYKLCPVFAHWGKTDTDVLLWYTSKELSDNFNTTYIKQFIHTWKAWTLQTFDKCVANSPSSSVFFFSELYLQYSKIWDAYNADYHVIYPQMTRTLQCPQDIWCSVDELLLITSLRMQVSMAYIVKSNSP